MARKSVTIRDVAREAGVSVATASRVLNGKDLVKPLTRDRILAVMAELGFSPSPAARRLSLGRTLTIGVVVSFLTRPQAAERLRGVDVVLADSEFDLVIYNVESVQKRDHYLNTLSTSQRADGLLVMSLPPTPETASALAGSPVPVVFIDVHTPTVDRLPRVIGDDVRGGALAARHLVELGHRSIAFIGDALAPPAADAAELGDAGGAEVAAEPGPAHAVARTATTARTASGRVDLGARSGRVVVLIIDAPPASSERSGGSDERDDGHPRPSFEGAVVARTTSSGASRATGGWSVRSRIWDRSSSAPRRPDSNSCWLTVVRPT